MSYWSTCFTGGISDRLIHLMGEHHLHKDRFYCRVCIITSHVLHGGMSYRWMCLAGVYVV